MSSRSATPGSRPYAPTERIETVDGLRLKVSVAGQGGRVPLVLISGIGAPMELWDPFRQALGTQTVAVDAPGVGGSQTMRMPRTMRGIARLVDTLLDRLGYETVDVLGL
ncbi:MAG TPA: alpha/beta hydrolase, partial [Candidatus Dormibacteraeota bacterium]|nr:alpha/beta hydrolase [Candidatus Dormibacteraeota bacterium]